MSFEFISNPTAKNNSFEFGKNFLKPSIEYTDFLYKPNFVLVDKNGFLKSSVSFFGDILPVYSSTRELTNIIVTSWDNLTNLVVLSRTFLVCLLSLLNIVIHNTVYQAYTLLISVYSQVLLLPERYSYVENKLESLLEIFSTEQGRELWWLEIKIDIKNILNRAYKLINLILEVSKKFYLAWLIFVVIGFLNYSVVFSNLSGHPNSFLAKFIQNYSLNSSSSPVLDPNLEVFSLSTPLINNDLPQIQSITKYTAEEGDSIEQIAYKFGVSVTTINLNNKISGSDINPGQEIYIPWVNGYIFNANNNVSPTELEKIYNVSAEQIQNQNISIFDPQISGFYKDSLILIPTDDFQKIESGNKLLEAQKKATEEAARRKTLSAKSIAYKKPNPSTIENASSTGFIWPTTGNISRCFSSFHRGCDIANFSSPAVYSVKKGVVRVGYEGGGYGNYVKIDHGNGVVTLYAHLNKIYVSDGQIVSQGEAIGQMGSTGNSTGTHLHFEVQIKGVRVDPLSYLPAR